MKKDSIFSLVTNLNNKTNVFKHWCRLLLTSTGKCKHARRPIMTLSKMSPVTFYIYASNSLIIHKENTKEINVQ